MPDKLKGMAYEFFYDSMDETLMRQRPRGVTEVYWPKSRTWQPYPDGLEGTQHITPADAAKIAPAADLNKPRT